MARNFGKRQLFNIPPLDFTNILATKKQARKKPADLFKDFLLEAEITD